MTWDELNQHELAVYSTAWCPDCKRLKQQLDEHGISYREIDIERIPAAAERLKKRTNRTAIPYLEVDGSIMVRGWHDEMPGHWKEAVFLEEIEQELNKEIP